MPFRDAWPFIGGLLFIVGFGAGLPLVALVGLGVMAIGLGSRWWANRLFDRVTLRRRLAERRVFRSEPVTLEVELENRKLLPLPWFEWRLALGEHVLVTGEQLAASAVPGLHYLVRRGAAGWYSLERWQFTLSCERRGYHPVGPASMRSSDLIGAWPSRTEDGEVDHLIVYPRVYRLPELGLPAERPFGDVRGGERIFEDPLRIAGLREYRPGDPLRRIDWKATARSGELRSRVYEPSATRQLYVFLNVDTLEHAWEGYISDELERLVSVAASVITWAAGARYAVGLLANGAYPDADRPIRLPPSRARDQHARLLEALAVIQPLTMGDLAGAIRRESGRLERGSTIVAVAALVPQALADALERLANEGHRVHLLATTDRAARADIPGVQAARVGGAFQAAEVLA
ncbi:DUF58 domain-containing protein [Tepidiforma flava]|uniref:DUF58 domain-containing protein n=1 Tax=Tepidiforma flava TaxID=3004094 RepID=A0ABY7M6U2_9CHLR|nr:DUF58 domain-containing protein [Tepidiforma flava]WBL35728.1 DUF58 domain-containing protein [Tepidiforma flava]